MIVPLLDMNTVFNMAINRERQQPSGTSQVIPQFMYAHGEEGQKVICMPTNLNQNNKFPLA